jgi:hypothetical protein
LHEQTAIIACIESLSFVDISNMRRRAASILLEADESDKDGGFWAKNNFFALLCSCAMKPADWA